MSDITDVLIRAIPLGIGATLVIDLWASLLKRAFAIPSLNWAMVGRWIGHFPRGRFVHASIGQAEPVRGELALGWFAHYATGVVFAALLLWLCGPQWAHDPHLLPALLFGVATVAFPFLLMQPGLGAGIAASKTPNPNQARLRSVMTHAVFGIGLYVSAWVMQRLLLV
jgi:hypothetical protein